MPTFRFNLFAAVLLFSLVPGCRCGQEGPPADGDQDEGPLAVLDVAAAMSLASTFVSSSLEHASMSSPEDIRRHFDAALASGDPEAIQTALGTLPVGERLAEDFDRQMRGLAALDRDADARAAAITRALRHPDDPEARRAASLMWATAPELEHGVTTWDLEAGRRLELFHGSSSIIFKWRDELTVFASFKPTQTIRRQYYRSEVAAERLVLILNLDVAIPPSREVRISWDDFHELTGIEEGDTTFHQTNAHLQWFGEGDERYLLGVSKAWIRGLERFPIEYTDVWTPWLDGTRDLEWLRSTSVDRAVDSLRDRPRDHYRGVAQAAHGMNAYRLAHQLSDLHVFDVLVNNYDRYQPEGLQLGMNCHLAGGGLMSLDNGAGFPTREDHDWRRVRSKVEPITRFSRTTYQMLSALDPVPLRAALFPDDPHADQEDDRFEYFVERWNWMLARINELIAEHGEAAVLVFP